MSTSYIAMSGDSDPDGAITQDVFAALTMSDENSTTWSVEYFDSQITVIDCFPDISWFDTSNYTSIAVLDSPEYI